MLYFSTFLSFFVEHQQSLDVFVQLYNFYFLLDMLASCSNVECVMKRKYCYNKQKMMSFCCIFLVYSVQIILFIIRIHFSMQKCPFLDFTIFCFGLLPSWMKKVAKWLIKQKMSQRAVIHKLDHYSNDLSCPFSTSFTIDTLLEIDFLNQEHWVATLKRKQYDFLSNFMLTYTSAKSVLQQACLLKGTV